MSFLPLEKQQSCWSGAFLCFGQVVHSCLWEQPLGQKKGDFCECPAWGKEQRVIPDVLQRQSGFIKLLIPPRSVSSFPIHLHPPIPKRHQGTGGAGGAPKAPSPKDSIVFSKVQLPHLPCSAWHPLRETALDLLQWEPLTPSSLLGVPTSSAAHQPGLSTWDCCRRSHGQRSLIHGA